MSSSSEYGILSISQTFKIWRIKNPLFGCRVMITLEIVTDKYRDSFSPVIRNIYQSQSLYFFALSRKCEHDLLGCRQTIQCTWIVRNYIIRNLYIALRSISVFLAKKIFQKFRTPFLFPNLSRGNYCAINTSKEIRQNVIRHFGFVIIDCVHIHKRTDDKGNCQQHKS